MIVKFFKHGTTKSGNKTAKSVKDYLLDKVRVQAQTANIIRGDEQSTSRLIDLCNQAKFSSTYTAGCLSFDEQEHPTDDQKQALMQSFEQALLPQFDPTRYACYWVEHTDKGRLELNFVFAKIDLATGKHLDIFQQRRDVTRLNNWKEIKIQQYGLIDPNAPARERDFVVREHTIRRADGTSPTDNYSQIKQDIDDYLRSNIELGYIVNSDDVKRYIEYIDGDISQATGYQVKQNKTGVSITNTETQDKFRLQGKIYARDFSIQASERASKNRIASERNERQVIYDREQAERLERASEWYDRLSQQRAKQLNKKYGREPKGNRPSLSLATSRPNSELVSRPTNQHPNTAQHESSRADRADTSELGRATQSAPSLADHNTNTGQSSPTRERRAEHTSDYRQDTPPIHTGVFPRDPKTIGQSTERADTSPSTSPDTSNRQTVRPVPDTVYQQYNRANQQYDMVTQQGGNRLQSDGQSKSTYDKISGNINNFSYLNEFSVYTSIFTNFRCFRFGLVETTTTRVSRYRTHNIRICSISILRTGTGIDELNNEQSEPQPSPRPLQLFAQCRNLYERTSRQIRERRAKRKQRLETQKRERERQAQQRLAERDSELTASRQRRDGELASTNPKISQLFERIRWLKERIERAVQRTATAERELDKAEQAIAGAVERTSDREQQHQQQRESIAGSVSSAIQASNTGLADSPTEPRHPSRTVQDSNGRTATADSGQPSLSQSIPDGSSELQSSESQLRAGQDQLQYNDERLQDSESKLRESVSKSETLVRATVSDPKSGLIAAVENEIRGQMDRGKDRIGTEMDQNRDRVESELGEMKAEYERYENERRSSMPRPF